MVAWAKSQHLYGAQAGYGPISPILPWRSTRNITTEDAYNYQNIFAEQHVYWQEERKTRFELPIRKLRKQLTNLRKQLEMKFMVQLKKLPTSLDRKCWK